MKNNNTFCLPLYNQIDHPSTYTVLEEIRNGEIEKFVARFINGLIHQTVCQTGSDRPIGETTVNRIIGDMFLFVNTLREEDKEYSYEEVKKNIKSLDYQGF